VEHFKKPKKLKRQILILFQNQTNMINIIIADDHPLILDGIITTLSDEPDIKIIGKALNGIQLLKLLENINLMLFYST
jgi:hypothetical protein